MATFLGFPVAASAASAAGMGSMLPQESWRSKIAGRFLPGAANMSPDDRDALVRQGLLGLAAGLASTSGQGTGAAIGNGLQSGLLSMNQGAQNLQEAQYRRAMVDRQLGDPAGLREFNAMTQGLSDEDKMRARRVRLGIEGRASSGGIGFDTFTDANGYQRPQRNNPRTGSVEIWLDEQQQWVPLGSMDEVAPGSQPVTKTTTAGGMPIAIGNDVPPAMRQMIEQYEAQQRPIPADVQLPEQRVPTFRPAPVPGLGRGRRKEDEAAAVASAQTNATRAAELQYLPTELGMRTGAALQQAQGEAGIQTAATDQRERDKAQREREQGLPQLHLQRGVLQDALDGLGTKYRTGPTNVLIPDVLQSADNQVFLTVVNQAVLDAADQLTGVISDRDMEFLKQATMSLTTREDANREILRRKIEIIDKGIQKANEGMRQPAQSSGSAPRRLRFNPATGRLE